MYSINRYTALVLYRYTALVDKLQSVQNFACRIVSGARKYDNVTSILKDLNWLPVTTQLYYRSETMWLLSV